MKNDYSKAVAAVMLKNSIMMICFTVLAIVFNKWWISLFAALFLSNLKIKGETDEKDDNTRSSV